MVAGNRTAGDMQHTQCTVLNGDEVILRKRAALNGQRTPLVTIAVADQGAADHGTGRICLLVAGVVDHGTAFDGHRALVADDVVGGLTHSTSVITLDGTGLSRAGVLNGDRTKVVQRSLSRTGAAAQGLAVQVESQILLLCDLDILSHILQQRHSLAVIGSRNSSSQSDVLGSANGGSRQRIDLRLRDSRASHNADLGQIRHILKVIFQHDKVVVARNILALYQNTANTVLLRIDRIAVVAVLLLVPGVVVNL